MRTNYDEFAERGDPWGAITPKPDARLLRRKRHPDGFVEWSVRDIEDENPGPNRHVKPNPYVRKPQPRISNAQARRAHNLLKELARV